MALMTSYRHDAPREPDYSIPAGLSIDSDSTIANVLAFDCTFTACEIRESHWENVTLRNCRMSDTKFWRMTVTDVVFENVDFDALRILGFWLDNVDWKDMVIKRLVVDSGLKMHCPFPLSDIILPILPMYGDSAISKTRASSQSPAWPPYSQQEPTVVRSVKLGWKRPATLPQHILDRIVEIAFPQQEMFVYDIRCDTSHTSYYWRTNYVLDELSYGKNRVTWAISTVEVNKDDSQAILAAITTHKPQIRLALLLLDKRCYELATKQLYSRKFTFQGSAESCLAFLHDHRRRDQMISNLSIPFHIGPTSFGGTKPSAWRLLFNTLAHRRQYLATVTLRLDKAFWTKIAASRSITDGFVLLNAHGLCVNDTKTVSVNQEWRNFLGHVCRLCGGEGFGVFFSLVVDGSDDPDKQKIVEELLWAMRMTMAGRYSDRRPEDFVCYERRLEYSCYWEGRRMTC